MKHYQPGELDQLINLDAPVLSPRPSGSSQITWTPIATAVPAKVDSLSGREATRQGMVQAEAQYMFVIRNRTDITEKTRITWGGRQYNIRALGLVGPRHNYLEIVAERGVAQ